MCTVSASFYLDEMSPRHVGGPQHLERITKKGLLLMGSFIVYLNYVSTNLAFVDFRIYSIEQCRLRFRRYLN